MLGNFANHSEDNIRCLKSYYWLHSFYFESLYLFFYVNGAVGSTMNSKYSFEPLLPIYACKDRVKCDVVLIRR